VGRYVESDGRKSWLHEMMSLYIISIFPSSDNSAMALIRFAALDPCRYKSIMCVHPRCKTSFYSEKITVNVIVSFIKNFFDDGETNT